jgi:nitrate/nitrite-specific signal transduction histidine kinase
VRDDGTGMPARERKHAGMGLRIMRYRAGMIGGSLAVQKEADGGTTVVCTVHLQAKPRPATRKQPSKRKKRKKV